MLSSMMSTVSSTLSTTSAVSTTSTVSTASSVMSAFADIGISEFSLITVICLIGLMAFYELLSVSHLWNNRLARKLNMAIVPMVLTFFCIVIFKISEIL